MSTDIKKEKGSMSGIFAGYFVILLHVFLILILAVAVIFLRGISEYLIWIVLGGLALVLGSGYLFYRKMKNDNKKLRDILNNPAFQGKSLEISFMGGMASLKVSQAGPALPGIENNGNYTPPPQIEDSQNVQVRELTQIANLLKNNLITQEEYERLKEDVLNKAQCT